MPHDPFRIPKEALLSFWACIALILIFYPAKRMFHNSTGNLFYVSLFFLSCIAVSIVGSTNYHLGVIELKRWACLIILFLTAARIDWSMKRLRILITATLVVGGIVGITVILEHSLVLKIYSYRTFIGRFYSFFGYQNILAQYLIVIFLWGFGLILTSRGLMEKGTALFLTLLIGTALLFTFTRGAHIAALIGLCLFLFLLYKTKVIKSITPLIKTRSVLIFLICMILFVTALFLLNKPFKWRGITFLDQTANRISYTLKKDDEDRFVRWKDSLNMIRSQPINGVGLGNYSIVYPGFKTGTWPHLTIYAHNEYLHMLAETGIVGLTGFTVFFIAIFRRLRRKISDIDSQDKKIVFLAILCGCTATLIHSIFSYNLHTATSSFFFFVGLGILCSYTAPEAGKSPSSIKEVTLNYIVITLTVLMALFGIYGEYDKIMGHYHLNQARVAMKSDDNIAGINHLLNAIKYQPYDFRNYIFMSKIYRKLGNNRMAWRYFKKARKLSPYSYGAGANQS